MANPQDFKKHLGYYTKFAIIGLVSLVLTSHVYLNSLELLLNVDIAYAGSVRPLSSDKLVPSLIRENTLEAEATGDFGKPEQFKLSKQSLRLGVIGAMKNDGGYLTRQNTLHVVYASKSDRGRLGDIILYGSKDWRGIDDTTPIEVDDNFFVDTNQNWRYMYRITDKKAVAHSESYVSADSGRNKAFIVLDDETTKQSIVYQAEFVSLQNIER